MKPMLKIGGHDYTKWVAEGGLTPTDSDVDSSKSGRNTLDALMVRNKIGAKMKWNVTLMDIPEEVAAQLVGDLKIGGEGALHHDVGGRNRRCHKQQSHHGAS